MEFTPVNDLERSLIKAASDPAHRPQFYRDFLAADLMVLEYGPSRKTSEVQTIGAGEEIRLVTLSRDDKTVVPCFSSMPRLKAFITKKENQLTMSAKALLELISGSFLVLNSGSPYGKEFVPEELAALLDGSIWLPSERYNPKKEIKVLIGQPSNYPHELVAALGRYFRTLPQVKRAWLAHYHNPARIEKAHTLVAIETTGEWDPMASGAGLVAQGVTVPDPPIDFMQMTGKPGIEDYFRKNAKPFYES